MQLYAKLSTCHSSSQTFFDFRDATCGSPIFPTALEATCGQAPRPIRFGIESFFSAFIQISDILYTNLRKVKMSMYLCSISKLNGHQTETRGEKISHNIIFQIGL